MNVYPVIQRAVQPIFNSVMSRRGGASGPKRTTSGLIYKTDFEDFSSWVNDGTFSKVADDALVSFAPLPITFADARNPMPIFDNGMLYLAYDTIDAATQAEGKWFTKWAESSDRGKTWKRNGELPSRLDKNGNPIGGVYIGYIRKEGNYFYHFRITTVNTYTFDPYGLMMNYPYSGDIFRAETLSGPWEYVADFPAFPNTWAHQSLIGSIYKSGSTYYLMVMGYNSSTTTSYGIFTSNSISGPFTQGDVILTEAMLNAIYGGSNGTENPKLFYHPVLQKYICLSNTYKANLQENLIQISSDIADWSGASMRKLQSEDELESTNQIGTCCPFNGPNQEVLIGSNNFIPLIYDHSGLFFTPLWHMNRKFSTVLLEPSRNALRFDGSALGKTHKAKPNSNFIAEFGAELPGIIGGDRLGFIFRSDGTGSNEYILKIQAATYLKLIKIVSGVETTVQTGSGSQVPILTMINRIKINATGTNIKAWLNGQLQINVTDSSFSSGTHIGISGENTNDGDIRLLSMHSTDVITCTGMPEGTEVDLRADGSICATSGLAGSDGTILFTLDHWPMESFYVNGKNYIISGGIWGGDTFNFSSLNLPDCVANTIISATVEDAHPSDLVINYTHSLNEDIIPDISAYSIPTKVISNISISGSTATITVSSPFVYGDVITVSYARPASNQVRSDPDTTYINSFSDHAVTNNVAYVPPAYSDEAIAYFARMSVQLSDSKKGIVDTYISALKSHSLWNRIDDLRLDCLDTEQQALLNIKGDYWNGSKVSTPTFTANRGWSDGSTTKYIESNFNPSLGGCVHVQDNAMSLVYLSVDVSATSYVIDRASSNAGGAWVQVNPASNIFGNINSNVATNRNSGVAHGIGFVWARRLNSAGMTPGHGVSGGTAVYTSGALYNLSFKDAHGTGSTQAMVMYGEALDTADLTNFENDTLTLLTALEAN